MQQVERRKHWQGLIREQEASGQSIRDFCRERNISEHSFYWWRRAVREERPVAFALVEPKPAAIPAGKQLELTLASGEVLRIPADIESLRVVFEALRAAR